MLMAKVVVIHYSVCDKRLLFIAPLADFIAGTAYHNCEVRIFDFTSKSTSSDAHVEETPESKRARGTNEPETDPVVLEELSHVVD
jgi:hypothetical protein